MQKDRITAKEYHRRYYEANKEKLAETQRRYREANKEKLAETKRRYREANKEKLAETQRRYYEANKLKGAGDPVHTRSSERRNCPNYQDCLTEAAMKNKRVVPCYSCQKPVDCGSGV